MKNKTKIYIASSIVLIVILIILAVITLIVKVNNDKIKPPASIENGEVSFNPDTMDEFCRMYYDNIYECSSLLITGTFTGDCINNEYYEKLFNKLNVDENTVDIFIYPHYISLDYDFNDGLNFFGDGRDNIIINDKGIFLDLPMLNATYYHALKLYDSSRVPQTEGGERFNSDVYCYAYMLDTNGYSGYDVKAMFLDGILNSDYSIGTVGGDLAINIKGGLKCSQDNYIANFINEKFCDDMVLSIRTEGGYPDRTTYLSCKADNYSFSFKCSEVNLMNYNTDTTMELAYIVEDLDDFIAEVRKVYGNNVYEFLD